MKIFITGISGLLGNNLAWYFRDRVDVVGCYNRHLINRSGITTYRADLCDYNRIRELVTTECPDVVIHCASRTDVDAMEKDREGGWQANVLTTRTLLDALRDMPAKLVFISTESVYRGDKGPFAESADPDPQNWYGATKLEGEKLVAARPGALILRTNIFGWNFQAKESLAEWFLNRLQGNESIKGFEDARFSSIYTFNLARIIEQCLEKNLSGTYNCASSDSCSKFEFGRRLAERFGFNKRLIQPAKLADVGFAAPRGNDLSLDTSKLKEALSHSLPTIHESMEEFYSDFTKGILQQIKHNNANTTYLNGFYPVRKVIPYGRQAIDDHDIAMVEGVLKSPFLTQGPMSNEFEQKLAGKLGCNYAVSVSSGTAALHIACISAGVGPGDEVITSSNTFVASANCAAYCGARPIIVDIDPATYNIALEEIEKKITKNTKAIIPVHFAGQSCDMVAVSDIVKKAEKKFGHKIFIIEDACHALGSKFRGLSVGSCAYSDMTVMSFHPVKHITTGEGGVILTNDVALDKTLRQLRVHGITNEPSDFVNKDLGFLNSGESSEPIVAPWYYEQQRLGFNYRITDMQCALGISQLEKLDFFVARRKVIVARYNEAFSGSSYLQVPFEAPYCDSNFHLYVLLIDFDSIGINRARFISLLDDEGIFSQVHYLPVHMQPYYQNSFGTKPGDCPNAEKYYQRCLSIPLFPAMTDGDIDRVIHHVSVLLESGQQKQ